MSGYTPMYSTYTRLGVRVSDPFIRVVRRASLKIAKRHRRSRDPVIIADRKKFYGWMIQHHRDAKALVRSFRLAGL